MRYALYARKSSASEDKQAQSIDDQLAVLRALATQRGLSIVAEFTESRSAKAPGTRPAFEELISGIRSGDFDAILCWHVNRLFRNPVDFGTLSWMLQTGQLQEILTPHHAYRTGDNVLLLSVENGMANQYIINLREDVERAIKSKLEKGIPPQLAPDGYINNLRLHTIEPDPERFDVIRKAWDLMLTGAYTVPEVLRVLNDEWGYRTIDRPRRPSKPLNRSSGYRLFNNLFYTGNFLYEGRVHKGTYRPMITLAEYERVQDIVAREEKTQRKRQVYAYTGLIRCGQCGCMITAEVKKGHLYYHCTNSKRICTKKGVTQKELDRQMRRELRSIHFNPELENLLLDIIDVFETSPVQELQAQYKQVSRRLESTQEELSELVMMRARRLIDDQTLTRGQEKLQGEVLTLRKSLATLQTQVDTKHDSLINAVHFATHVVAKFDAADTWAKRRIVQVLGGSYVLTDKVLTLEKHPLLHYIEQNREAIERAILSSGKQKITSQNDAVPFGVIGETLAELLRLGIQYQFPAVMWEVSG
jgi:site-specific DNA recombinase